MRLVAASKEDVDESWAICLQLRSLMAHENSPDLAPLPPKKPSVADDNCARRRRVRVTRSRNDKRTDANVSILTCACGGLRLQDKQTMLMVCSKCGWEDELAYEGMEKDATMNSAASGMGGQSSDNAGSGFIPRRSVYRPLNHFKDRLAQIQGKKRNPPIAGVLRQILREAKRHRYDLATMQVGTIRTLMKQIHLKARFYEYIPWIHSQLTGVPLPIISPALQQRLEHRFMVAQTAFLSIIRNEKKPSRVNFLSYPFVLFKFCQLERCYELLNYFPMLRSAVKLHRQDAYWRKICQLVRWKYIRSG